MLINKLYHFFRSYRLLIVLSIILTSLSVQYFATNILTEKIIKSSRDIKRQIRKFHISKTDRMFKELDVVVKENQYPYMSKNDARMWLLETAENLRSAYDAQIRGAIKEENSHFSIEIDFDFIPENPEDFLALANYFETSISPIFLIDRMTVSRKDGITTVKFRLNVKQPFYGGKYVF